MLNMQNNNIMCLEFKVYAKHDSTSESRRGVKKLKCFKILELLGGIVKVIVCIGL